MIAAPQTWWLTYRDPTLEAEYQADAARRTAATHRVLWSVTCVAWALGYWLDLEMSGSPANRDAWGTARTLILPVLLAVAAVGWLPTPLFARWRHIASGAAVAVVLGGQILMALLVPEPLKVTDQAVPASIIVTIFVLCAWCGALSVHLWIPVAATLTQLVAYSMVGKRFPNSQPTSIVFWYLTGIGLGWLIAWLLNGSRRATFLALKSLEAEQQRSERLLLNMLPTSIAERLKASPTRIADQFQSASILFGDIVGFTPLMRELPPDQMVAALDELFSKFDDMAQRLGLEKIKTIGDAYMVVGGVPMTRPDHAEAVAEMALEMRDLVAGWSFANGRKLSMRIGIDSGPVVAGVIGKQKFVYDLWGDAVNTASRMESQGTEGQVQVTEATRALLAHRFAFRDRGLVDIKGKGEMHTWFLDGKLP